MIWCIHDHNKIISAHGQIKPFYFRPHGFTKLLECIEPSWTLFYVLNTFCCVFDHIFRILKLNEVSTDDILDFYDSNYRGQKAPSKIDLMESYRVIPVPKDCEMLLSLFLACLYGHFCVFQERHEMIAGQRFGIDVISDLLINKSAITSRAWLHGLFEGPSSYPQLC